jgi:hypothetical protein
MLLLGWVANGSVHMLCDRQSCSAFASRKRQFHKRWAQIGSKNQYAAVLA